LLETPPLRWRSDAKEGYVVMAILEKPPHVTLPPGSWTLVCLSDAPISNLVSLEKNELDSESKHADAVAEAALQNHHRLNSLLQLTEGSTEEEETSLEVGGAGGEGGTSTSIDEKAVNKKSPSAAASKSDSKGTKRTSMVDGTTGTTSAGLSMDAGGSAVAASTKAKKAKKNKKDEPPKADQIVWKLPHGPMARAHRWGGVYQPNKELKLMSDLLSGGSTDLTLRVEAFPSSKSPVPNFALRLKVFQKVKRAKQPVIDGVRPAPLNPRLGFECIADVRGMDRITLELVHVSAPLPHNQHFLQSCMYTCF
jgi:hypothetical protein